MGDFRLNRKDHKDREGMHFFLCGLRGLCGSILYGTEKLEFVLPDGLAQECIERS